MVGFRDSFNCFGNIKDTFKKVVNINSKLSVCNDLILEDGIKIKLSGNIKKAAKF